MSAVWPTVAGQTHRVSRTITPPAGSATMEVTVSVLGTAVEGERVWFDNLNIGGAAYFDGDTPDTATDVYSWTGTAKASSSTYGHPNAAWVAQPVIAYGTIVMGPGSLEGTVDEAVTFPAGEVYDHHADRNGHSSGRCLHRSQRQGDRHHRDSQ